MTQDHRTARVMKGSTVGQPLRHELADTIDSVQQALMAMNGGIALCTHLINVAGVSAPSSDDCTPALAWSVRETLRLAHTVLEDAQQGLVAIRASSGREPRPPAGPRSNVTPIPTGAVP